MVTTSNRTIRSTPCADDSTSAVLLNDLVWLDRLLERSVSLAAREFGSHTTPDRFRGLYIAQSDIDRVLAREPGASPFLADGCETEEDLLPSDVSPHSHWLCEAFSLSAFDLGIFLIALAPELDLRYERIYAYLQDDVTRKRPTVELALNLLCATPRAKLSRRCHFLPESALFRTGALHLIADSSQAQPPLLAHALKPDDQIVLRLLRHRGLDGPLTSVCRLIQPRTGLIDSAFSDTVRTAVHRFAHRVGGGPQVVYFHGPSGAGQREAAEALARELGSPLLLFDLPGALANPADLERSWRPLTLAARCQSAVLCFEGFDALAGSSHPQVLRRVLETICAYEGVSILIGTAPWSPPAEGPRGMVRISFAWPDHSRRRAFWEQHLDRSGLGLAPEEVDTLAGRFRLTQLQIADAVAAARHQVAGEPAVADLLTAARDQAAGPGTSLARTSSPRNTWEDLVLPEDAVAQLHELCNHARYRHVVYGRWGFGGATLRGRGAVALFTGPPGTGKTLAAEVVAADLSISLCKIDLSQVVSKYIGETEKNLDRVFTDAERSGALLFFDEADALFGQRSQIRDAHDRYANLEVAYLLQKMEEYDGVGVLATNLHANMDEAFIRRLTFRIEFPLPDEVHRLRIWRQHFPAAAPRAADLALDFLANRFRLSGGNIKNVVHAGAFLAAAAGEPIGMRHLVAALRREFQKMGKTCDASEFGPYAPLLRC
jgi:AAA+ superfamily predicted ATPase